ncbi:hypothetical protein ACNKHQ_22640 [Shigella flexneri]
MDKKRELQVKILALAFQRNSKTVNGLILEEAIAFILHGVNAGLPPCESIGKMSLMLHRLNHALCQVGEWIYNQGKSLAKDP